MAHELTINKNGKAEMFAVVKEKHDTPWHKLGTWVNEAPSTKEAIKLAGLDWSVETLPIYTKIDNCTVPIEEAKAVHRTDTGDILGVVGNRYHTLQNVDAFKVFDSLVDTGFVTLETAGSLFGGKKIWIQAKINDSPIEVVKNDVVEKYILMSNSHDGTLSVRFGYSPQRVVCQNTLHVAIKNKKSQMIRIKHSKNMQQNLDLVRETMNIVNQTFAATQEQYKRMANSQINQSDLKTYIKKVFSVREDFEKIYLKDEQETTFNETRDVETRVQKDVIELFETGRGSDIKGVQGTVWGAYNAVTEYLTHYRGRSVESRFSSLHFSSGAVLNKRAFFEGLALI